jgi:hypothetical protein
MSSSSPVLFSTTLRQNRIWTNYFDVVILPPPAVQDHAIALSRQLEKYGGQFVLGKNRFLPHISLYHIPVLPEDFADFSQAVQQSASRHRGGELRLRSIDMPLLMTDKPAWLRQLQRDVVSQTIRYFDWKYGGRRAVEYRTSAGQTQSSCAEASQGIWEPDDRNFVPASYYADKPQGLGNGQRDSSSSLQADAVCHRGDFNLRTGSVAFLSASDYANRTRQNVEEGQSNLRFRISDLSCRIRPISKSSAVGAGGVVLLEGTTPPFAEKRANGPPPNSDHRFLDHRRIY